MALPSTMPMRIPSKVTNMNIETLREFLNWCLAINVGIFILSTVNMKLIGGWASKIHAKMFDVDATWVRQAYFGYLANYKIAVLVLVVVPWIALHLMGS
jgi:hypothetical protein